MHDHSRKPTRCLGDGIRQTEGGEWEVLNAEEREIRAQRANYGRTPKPAF